LGKLGCGYVFFLFKDKLAASFCQQVAAQVQYMFCSFDLVKNSETTKARLKKSSQNLNTQIL